MDVGGGIDRAGDGGCGGDVAGGTVGVGGEELGPAVVGCVGAQAVGGGGLAAAEGIEVEARCGGVGRDDVDDAAEGGRAVEVGAAAGGDGDGVDGEGGDLVPVDPAAEGVVEGGVVGEDEGAAGGGGAEAAQRDALAGGVLHARAGAAVEFEAGLLAQLVVELGGGIVVELLRGEGVEGVCGCGEIERGAGCGDDDLLGDRGGGRGWSWGLRGSEVREEAEGCDEGEARVL